MFVTRGGLDGGLQLTRYAQSRERREVIVFLEIEI
jgi:hypothetical protein